VKTFNIAGHKVPAWALVGGGLGTVLAVYVVRKRLGSASSASSAGANAIDPVTGLPASEDNTVDPETGLTYLAEATQYGSVSAAEAAFQDGTADIGETAGAGIDSGFPTIGSTGTSADDGGENFSTNAQWSQAVTAGLVSLGYSSTDVAAALGLYFQAQPLGTAPDGVSYLSIVQAAVAEFGPPPVAAPSIIAPPSGSGDTGTGAGAGTGTGTGTTGSTPPPASAPQHFEAPPGFSVTPYDTYVDLGWGAPSGASVGTTSYHSQILRGGALVSGSDDVQAMNHTRVTGLSPSTAYEARVSVDPNGEWATKSFTTKAK
jgi:hypothetical protein